MTTQLTPATDPTMPSENYSKDHPNQVIWMGDGTVSSVPSKTITFVNNTGHTVYPFLSVANNAAQCSTTDADDHYACSNYANDPANNSGSIYDPRDPWNHAYRGYIGYTGQDGKNYLGLPASQTVTISIPLVFWDAGRIFIASESTYLIPPEGTQFGQSKPPINPYQFYWVNQDGSETLRRYQTMDHSPTSPGLKAVVMWYHAKEPVGPNNDAPAQLLEFTIRDPWQMNLNSNLDKNTLGPLINYDVSYVDTIYLPVAMEATDVLDNGTRKAFGWIGASQKEEDFQQAFQAFISAGASNGLGQYFGTDEKGNTRGYTQYNITDSGAGIKLPSGAQALGDSPFQDKRSSYDQNTYLLTGGGTGGIEATVSSLPEMQASTTVPITWDSVIGPAQQQTLQYGVHQPGTMDVMCADGDEKCISAGVIQPGTKLLQVDVAGSNVTVSKEVINAGAKSNPPQPVGTGIKFKRPVSDYVSSAIISLWYSWAKYYMDNNQVSQQQCSGTLSDRVITFTNPVLANTLVPGMKVTGNGIPPNSDGSFCTITAVSLNASQQIQSVTLSELATGKASDTYTFAPLEPLPGSDDPLAQTFPLCFEDDAATALAFSRQVYQAMSALSTIPLASGTPCPLPMWIVYNTIGCNVGEIPHIGEDLSPPDDRIGTEITNRIKSILRGVPDFTDQDKYPESTWWYPDPSTQTGNCNKQPDQSQFNVYNLDPFVWFVHKQLKLSGYGFSVDDDVADVGANGATNLAIAIGGLAGLPISKQWSPENPYGS